MTQNGGDGIRVPSQAVQGGTITINVGSNVSSVEVGVAGSSDIESFPVESNKDVTVPVPPVPGGTVLFITTGTGLQLRVYTVEVLALTP